MNLVGQVISTKRINYYKRNNQERPITNIEVMLVQKIRNKFKNVAKTLTLFDEAAEATQDLEPDDFIKLSGASLLNRPLNPGSWFESHGKAQNFSKISYNRFLENCESMSFTTSSTSSRAKPYIKMKPMEFKEKTGISVETPEGKVYLTDLSRKLNITYSALYNRIFVAKWPMDKVLSTPVRRKIPRQY